MKLPPWSPFALWWLFELPKVCPWLSVTSAKSVPFSAPLCALCQECALELLAAERGAFPLLSMHLCQQAGRYLAVAVRLEKSEALLGLLIALHWGAYSNQSAYKHTHKCVWGRGATLVWRLIITILGKTFLSTCFWYTCSLSIYRGDPRKWRFYLFIPAPPPCQLGPSWRTFLFLLERLNSNMNVIPFFKYLRDSRRHFPNVVLMIAILEMHRKQIFH